MKITGLQLFWMITIMDIGMTIIMTTTPSVQYAKQDVWMSILLAGCLILFATLLITKAASLYPEQTLVQLSRTVFGRWFGGLVMFIYFVQWYTIIPIVLRQFNDALTLLILPTTPKTATMALMILLIAYVTHQGGIVSIARCSEVLGPIILLMILAVLGLSLTTMDAKNLLPVFSDTGILKIVNGSLAPASYLGHSVEYLMLGAFLYNPRKGAPYAYYGILVALLFTLMTMTMTVAVLGPGLVAKLWYPFFEMTRKISLWGFLENFDPLTVVIWVASVFIKLSIYLFVTCYGTAQFLKIKNWRMLVWFIAPIMLLFALMPRNVVEATSHYLLNYWVPIALPVNMIGLPFLLLVVGKIRKNAQSGSQV